MWDGATVLLLTAAVPLLAGLWLNRRFTIVHALGWAGLAWAGWLGYALVPNLSSAFAALTLTAGAGIGVFGARRPGVVAWHFVVGTLIIVLWIGWAEGLIAGHELKLGPARLGFLSVVLALTALNYLPTRFVAAAVLLGAGCAGVLVPLWSHTDDWPRWPLVVIALAPWMVWLAVVTRAPTAAANARWRQFRDRFGVVWAQRLREQFQAAAKHNAWPVKLDWDGLQGTGSHGDEIAAALAALERRFCREGAEFLSPTPAGAPLVGRDERDRTH